MPAMGTPRGSVGRALRLTALKQTLDSMESEMLGIRNTMVQALERVGRGAGDQAGRGTSSRNPATPSEDPAVPALESAEWRLCA